MSELKQQIVKKFLDSILKQINREKIIPRASKLNMLAGLVGIGLKRAAEEAGDECAMEELDEALKAIVKFSGMNCILQRMSVVESEVTQ